MKMNIIFDPIRILTVICISFIAVMLGCKKSVDTQNSSNNSYRLDSVITNYSGLTSSIHFIYDGQGRVVEDKYQVGDTLQERYVYEYNGSDTFPFRKKHYYGLSLNPDAISVFQYNGSNQKLYDSTYFPSSSEYVLIKINYYNSNRVAVLKDIAFGSPTAHNWLADTLYLNNTGQLDSIRSYKGTSQSIFFGSWKHWTTKIFTQFDNRHSIFANLSSSKCNVYPSYQNFNFGSFTTERFFPVVDYYNQFNCGKISTYITSPLGYGPDDITDKQFHFNVDDMPTGLTQTYTYQYNGGNWTTTSEYRFVYQ